jgi:hypothetical protein
MLSKLRKHLAICVLPAFLAAGLPEYARAQNGPGDTLVLPALAPRGAAVFLPPVGLPTSSRGARGTHWSVAEKELTATQVVEKALQRNPAPEGPPAYAVEARRLAIVEEARRGFADYYQAYRQLEQHDEGLRRARHCRAEADARRQAGSAPLQDFCQADVELGRLGERRVTLEKEARVACARLNALFHLPPESALPPPPALLPFADTLPEVGVLHEAALSRRPDFLALRHRRGAAPASPAELQQSAERIRLDVETAFAEVSACARSIRLLHDEVLPAATANAVAAESAYVTGRVPFLSWVEAERGLLEVHLRRHEVLAGYHRARAALARAVADPPGGEVSAPPPRFTEVFREKVYPAAHLTQPAPR